MANLTNLNNKFLVQTGGNVGINKTSPEEKLDIAGSVLISNNEFYKVEKTDGTNYKIAGLTNGNVIQIGAIDYTSAGTIFAGGDNVSITTGGAAGTTRIKIASSGNVGIGTATPDHTLVVQASANTNANILAIKDSDGTRQMTVEQDSSGNGRLFVWNTSDANKVLLHTNGNSYFNGGNVGIGTTSPNRLLEVNSNASDVPQIRAAYNATNYLDIKHNIINAVSSGGNDSLQLQTAGTTGLIIDVNRNVGIGTTSPTKKLHIVGDQLIFGNLFLQSNANGFRTIALNTTDGADNQELYLCGGATASSTRGAQVGVYGNEVSSTGGSVVIVAGNVSTGDIDFLTANAQRMIINNAGNVGIGTTSPSQLLHVNSSTNNPTGIGLQNSERYYSVRSNNYSLVFTDETVGTERMRITSAGDVAIGSTDAEKRLEVKSDTTYDGILIDTLSAPEIVLRDRGNSDTLVGTGRHALDGFHIDTYSGNAFFIKGSNRYVGIGTTSPATKLQVANAGEVVVRSSMTAADGYRGGFEADNQHTGGTIWSMFSTNNSDGYFGGGKFVIANETMGDVDVNTPSKFVIDGAGSVLIGDGIPSGTPEADYRSLEIGRQGNTITGAPWKSNLYLTCNATITGGSSAFTYRYASEAPARMDLEDGIIRFYNAAAGTAGNTISWSEKMRIAADGNVGIGTTAPNQTGYSTDSKVVTVKAPVSGGASALELIGLANADGNLAGAVNFMSYAETAPLAQITGVRHTADTAGKLYFKTSGSPVLAMLQDQTAYFYNTLYFSSSGVGSISWGSMGGGTGFGIRGESGRGLSLGSNGAWDKMIIDTGGNVAIGTTATQARLEVRNAADGSTTAPQFLIYGGASSYGAFHFLDSDAYHILTNSAGRDIEIICDSGGVKLGPGDTAWSSNSDENLKENIKPLNNVLDKIKDYRCVEYNFKDDENEDKKIGFIAQDWQKDFSQVVNKNKQDVLSIKYTETIPVLLKAIQELEARVKELENK